MYCTSKYLIIVLEAGKKNNVLNMINPENQDLIKNKQCSYCGEWLYIDLRQWENCKFEQKILEEKPVGCMAHILLLTWSWKLKVGQITNNTSTCTQKRVQNLVLKCEYK